MGIDAKTLAAARKYTDNSIAGGGISAGKNCVISSIAPITGGNRVTFQWTLDNGTVKTGTMDVMDGVDGQDGATGAQGPQGPAGADGADGLGIDSVEVNAEGHLIITYDDGTTEDAGAIQVTAAVDSVNGKTGDVELTASDVGALPDDTAIPSKISDLQNDSNFIETSATAGLVKNDGTIDTKTYVETETGKGLSTNDYDNTAKAAVDGLSTALDGKVDKVNGKGLSTNDYDDTEKGKVASAITNTVNNLVNYYLKTETYSKTEVDTLINAISTMHIEAVSTLPTSDIHTNVIYLVPKDPTQTSNVKDEYINLDGTTAGWEKIGDTEIDLSDYVTTTALNTALAAYTTTADLTTLLTGYIQKSNTAGLVKNDGTIDTTSYATAASVTAITDGTTIDSFSDVETALSGKADTSDIPDITVKTDKVSGATNGNFAGLDANGNLTDSGKKAADFATPTNVSNLENRSTRLVKDTVGWTGKNLLKNEASTLTTNGITWTVNDDGTILINGTNTDNSYLTVNNMNISLDVDTEYILSGNTTENADEWYLSLFLQVGYEGMTNYQYIFNNNPTGVKFKLRDFIGESNLTSLRCYARVGIRHEAQTVDNVTFYPMIRRADITDPTFEPYHESVEVMHEEEIHGVNLLKNTAVSKTENGITFTVNTDGSVTVNGTASSTAYLYLLGTDAVIPNIFGGCKLTGCPSGGSGTTYGLVAQGFASTVTSNPTSTDQDNGSGTIVSPSTVSPYIRFYIRVQGGTTVTNLVFKPMLRKADIEDSTYRPYNNQAIQNQLNAQGVLGAKNLLQNKGVAQTVSGVTFTLNADGSVTANGTATAAIPFNLSGNILDRLDPTQEYILSGCPKGGSASTYRIYVGYNPGNGNLGNDFGDGVRFSLSSTSVTYTSINIFIFISSGAVLNNLVFKPMLRLASDPDDTYVPYAKTNQQLTDEGPTVINHEVVWNSDLNLGTSKGGQLYQWGRLYFVSYWFKATTALTGNTPIVKLPKKNLVIGNYVITEDNDTAVWGGRATKDNEDYVSISCPIVVDKTYRCQCVCIDVL